MEIIAALVSDFNPRPPRGGRHVGVQLIRGLFISIHAPRGGGRPERQHSHSTSHEISIHAPREGGDQSVTLVGFDLGISIHAPREGGDEEYPLDWDVCNISIHAPREGGDLTVIQAAPYRVYFNPRPPRGGRPHATIPQGPGALFQSTPPARGATGN